MERENERGREGEREGGKERGREGEVSGRLELLGKRELGRVAAVCTPYLSYESKAIIRNAIN